MLSFQPMRSFLVALLLFCTTIIHAAITLPALVSDNMVLQRDVKLPVWGWSTPGAAITVQINRKNYKAVADATGKWMVKLDALKAGGPYEMILEGDGSSITIKNILAGDVWLCSGQSNMVFDFNNARAKALYAADIAASANDQIRQILIPRTWSPTPAADFKTKGWQMAQPQVLNGWSVAAYFFARNLFEQYHVPIGLINTCYGGTRVEAWTSEEALKTFPQFDRNIQLLHDTAQVNNRVNTAKQKLAEWNAKPEAERATTPKPATFGPQNLASALYNAMIAPLIPYAIKGAIWYQGEGNAPRAYEYRDLFPNMIKDWRTRWQQGDFPFIFQQLVNFKPEVAQPAESDWAELREAQTMTLSKSPNTAMTVGIDIGEAGDIHPVNKKDVGYRMFLAARKLAYADQKLVAYGPLYKSMQVKGDKIIISFTNTGTGLVTKDGGPVKYIAIAGADKKFVWADAVIKGNTIEVSSSTVSNPVAVRYAWADNPAGCNLFNKEGLPASPFRTDDWPGITVPK
jgi:sialate O-acetylesterase